MPGKTRTTLTLDPDVVQALEQRRRKDKRPFRDIVNDALRAGLAAARATRPKGLGEGPPAVWAFTTFDFGEQLIGKGLQPSELLALIDEEEDRERIAKMMDPKKP